MIQKILEAYGKHLEKTVSHKRALIAIKNLSPLYKSTVRDLPKQVSKYIDGRKVSAGTINRELNVLQAALRWSFKRGDIDFLPAVERLPSPPPRSKFLTDAQVESLLNASKRFKHNIDLITGNFVDRTVQPIKSTSVEALGGLISQKKQFDFIYIDGSHISKDVLTDACMAWPLLKKSGFMVFDDYAWKPQGFSINQRPKIAIDAFVNMFEDELTIAHFGYQLIVRKV